MSSQECETGATINTQAATPTHSTKRSESGIMCYINRLAFDPNPRGNRIPDWTRQQSRRERMWREMKINVGLRLVIRMQVCTGLALTYPYNP